MVYRIACNPVHAHTTYPSGPPFGPVYAADTAHIAAAPGMIQSIAARPSRYLVAFVQHLAPELVVMCIAQVTRHSSPTADLADSQVFTRRQVALAVRLVVVCAAQLPAFDALLAQDAVG